jgi:hypothetical protein
MYGDLPYWTGFARWIVGPVSLAHPPDFVQVMRRVPPKVIIICGTPLDFGVLRRAIILLAL